MEKLLVLGKYAIQFFPGISQHTLSTSITTSMNAKRNKPNKQTLMIIFISIFLILLINYYSFYWWERLDTVMS